MSRYINVDSLIPETVDEVEYGGDDGRRLYSRKITVYSKKQIDEAPTADVVEVMHGEWIMINEQLAKCSVCGGYESTNGKDKTGKGVIFKMQKKFCPHCGADMRGESNGE